MPAVRTIGNYVLGPMLGRGGMSSVHAAEHRFLGDRVAIKLLRSQLARDPDATAAFLAEATRTRAIEHPAVVRVLDFGSDGDDLYLVMEHLEGETLAANLARAGRLDEATVRRLGAAIADGVAAAHARGIIHRDLKPANIRLVADQPKILDFGIARHVGHGGATTTGSQIGTLAYMAPEQLAGGLVAPCVDIWALGVVLYEALAGRLPFDDFDGGRCPQLLEPAPPLGAHADVSAALEALVSACLARDPGSRPPSMQAVAEALRGPAGEQRFTEELPPPIAAQEARLEGSGARSAGSGGHPARPVADPDAGRAVSAQRATARVRAPRGRTVGLVVAVAVVAGLAGVSGGWALRNRRDRMLEASGLAAVRPGVPIALHDAPAQIASSAAPTPTGGASPSSSLAPTPAARAPAATPSEPAPAAPTPSAPPSEPAPGTPARAAATGPQAVVVRSAPAGAAVIVGGKRVGVTPATLALELPASIVVTRTGYRPSRVRAERAGSIDVRLVPTRRARPNRPAAGETLD